jgi:hypothetical protein
VALLAFTGAPLAGRARSPVRLLSGAIVAGAALIAASILIVGRWEAILGAQNIASLVQLDRWTGSMRLCRIDASSVRNGDLAGMRYVCTPQTEFTDEQVSRPPK